MFAPEAMDDARQRCQKALEDLGKATLAQIRDAWEVTRKYAIPLCEWFDSNDLTKRDGDVRVAGPKLDQPLIGSGDEQDLATVDASE